MKKNSLKKLIITLVVVAVVGVGGYFGYSNYLAPSTKAVAQSYMVAKVTKGSIKVTITASGTVSCAAQNDLLSQNTGTITSLPVKVGQTIKKGDTIAKISDTSAEQSLQQAQNNLTTQNLQLTKLKNSLNTLYTKSPVAGTVKAVYVAAGDDAASVGKAYGGAIMVITPSDSSVNGGKDVQIAASGTVAQVYVSAGNVVNKGDNLVRMNGDDIQNSITSQNLSIQQAQAQITDKQNSVNNENVTSPIDGIIASLTASAGDSITPGKTIATVLDPSKMQTVVPVDELDVSKISLGQKATVTIDAIKGQTFDGQVTAIANIGKVSGGVTTYDVTIAFTKSDGLKVGMTTNANIDISGKDNILMIPSSALQRGNVVISANGVKSTVSTSKNSKTTTTNNNRSQYPGGKNSMSFIQSDKTTSELLQTNSIQVKTGISNSNYIEVTSGLNEGDQILVPMASSTGGSSSQNKQNQSGFGGMGGYGGGFGGGGNFGGGGATTRSSSGGSRGGN